MIDMHLHSIPNRRYGSHVQNCLSMKPGDLTRVAHPIRLDSGSFGEKECVLSVLDQLGIGAFIVDQDWTIVGANEFAEKFDEQIRSLTKRLKTCQLEQSSTGEWNDGSLIGSGPVGPFRGARKVPCAIRILPLSSTVEAATGRKLFLLIVADLETPMIPTAASLRTLFTLTRAEARIALCLAEGETLKNIAIALNLSLGTVRIHLKSIFLKTNTHRQSDLVSLLMRLTLISSRRPPKSKDHART